MRQLLVATNNAHKLKELLQALGDIPFQVVTPKEIGIPDDFDPAETGSTFAENALIKAKAYGQESGLLAMADDSGTLVHALNNEPGVFSKRWIEGSDADRNAYLLKRLDGKADRSAHYNCTLALYDPHTQDVQYFDGQVYGTIALAERGTAGFGYDPLFIPEGYTQTFAELGDEVKSKISHRHRALAKLKEYLLTL